jgi:hypothetical protein
LITIRLDYKSLIKPLKGNNKMEENIKEGATFKMYIKFGFSEEEAIAKIEETRREMEGLIFLTPEE